MGVSRVFNMKVGIAFLAVAILAFDQTVASEVRSTDCFKIYNSWDGGYTGAFLLKSDTELFSWLAEATFDNPFSSVNIYNADNVQCYNGTDCTFTDKGWNGNIKPDSPLELGFMLQFSPGGQLPSVISLTLNGGEVCGTEFSTTKAPSTTQSPTKPSTKPASTTIYTGPTIKTTTPKPSGKCNTVLTNYREVLKDSLLFYEAQRSGKLPPGQRVKWRKDSALKDGSDVGMDLTGGYYDAGDYVKFGFPMAYTITILAWGGITFKDGYVNAGQFGYLQDALKWGTDYFIKAHPEPNVFYGQVGDGNIDHSWIGRPEDMTMKRPSFKIDAQNPGSDLAGETAAAMAATSIVFRDTDSDYADILVSHAKDLFNFADKYRRTYDQSITNAANFYRSYSGYKDELVWAAIWLYKATKEAQYLDKAKSMYDEFDMNGKDTTIFSWDDKTAAIYALMTETLPDVPKYSASLQAFCDHAVFNQQRSPKGELYYLQWGSLRYATSAAFVCLQASELIPARDGLYTELAVSQAQYIMGESGRSLVVGYGSNPPVRPHHRSSLCPDAPKVCDWGTFQGSQPNAHVLYGALVGGPKAADDYYKDDRGDYVMNEVACDYNAGFQGMLAGLHMKKCI